MMSIGNIMSYRLIIYHLPMNLNYPVKITSKMNGKAITFSEGEYNSKPGNLIVASYQGFLKQKFTIYTSK